MVHLRNQLLLFSGKFATYLGDRGELLMGIT